MVPHRVEILRVKRDRCARKGIIRIGQKEVLLTTFAPQIMTAKEMKLFVRLCMMQPLDHVHACVVKLHDAADTIKPIKQRSKNAALDGDYRVRSTYANAFLDFATIIIDPATDSMKYEGHMTEFATSHDVPFELRKFANKMEGYRVRKKKGRPDPEGKDYETRIKTEYREYWDWLMLHENLTKLQGIINETVKAEFDFGADIGLGPVPAIDSEEMLKYTKTVNRLTLAIWPKDNNDNCATYLILSPEVFSNPPLMKKIIEYLKEVQTKFVVIKFKNLALDSRKMVDEATEMQNLLQAINEVKDKHEERIFVALESGFQMYPFAAGGFDIVSTSMTGQDGDWPFKRGPDKTTINGYFDLTWLIFRDDKFVRKVLAYGGFPHDGCICSTLRDYETARKKWYDVRREHYVRQVDALYGEIWGFIDQNKIELAKGRLSSSRIANLKHILPMLDYF